MKEKRASRFKWHIPILSAICLVLILVGLHLRLWWRAQETVSQHMEILARVIARSWIEEKEQGASVIVPASAQYSVKSNYPYVYALRLNTGYTFKIGNIDRGTKVIAYFDSSPRYPWWYRFDIFDLKEKEVLLLRDDFSIHPDSRRILKEENLDF